MTLAYIVDWFTLYHFLLWAAIGIALELKFKPALLELVLVGLILGVGWEVLELVTIEPWLNFHEPVLNRWLTDPIADVSGVYFGAKSIRYIER